MSYRSVQRVVLGETNLERKCRVLFGVSLLLLIVGAFWWVDSIAEQLVANSIREKGRDYVDSAMLKSHWQVLETEPDNKRFLEAVIQDLPDQKYGYEFIALEPEEARVKGPDNAGVEVRLPQDGWERENLPELKQKWLEIIANERTQALADSRAPPLPEEEVGPAGTLQGAFQLPVTQSALTRDRRSDDNEQYYFYQAVRWEGTTCKNCHFEKSQHALAAAEAALIDPRDTPPFRVVRVSMPYGDTQAAINWTRAILITTAIVTVVLAMIALYVVIRYVVVKPLQHLRDVSDEISEGSTEVRANIQTNDEFEDLADSFNRMLRHLVEAQDQLRGANEALDVKVEQLAQANMQLYEANRLKSDFLASMSHELRTPLNSIIGFSDVLREIDSLNGKQKRYVSNIQKSGKLLLDMINDILDLAKLEAGRMEVRPGEFQIEHVVQAQCDMLRSLSEEKNIDLEAHVPPELPPLYQDQSKVQQILTNLLSNAIKFTPEGGRITVSALRDPEANLMLTVADTGVGIAEEDRDVIFEKFRQASTTAPTGDHLTREYSGTGLGLSIIKELCTLMGGDITFTSELGRGSSFTVRLPWRHERPTRHEPSIDAKLHDLTRPKPAELRRLLQDAPAESAAS